MKGPRRRAAQALDRILDSRAPAESFLTAAAKGLDERDARLLRELVLGTLRWLRRLDHVLETASGRRVKRVRRKLLAPLRIGLYQLLYLDRVPAFAAVDEAVEDAKRRAGAGGAGFANAVLRKVAGRAALESWPVTEDDPIRRLAIETSHPEFLVRRWVERFGEDAARGVLDANNRARPIWLLSVTDRKALSEELARDGVETSPSEWVPTALRVRSGDPFTTEAFARGAFYAQDETSQAAALVPPPEAGERVLDAAAAPGGKGFALTVAEPMLRLLSGDANPGRLARLRRNQKRLGLTTPIAVFAAGAPPFRPAFDRVVADLPCSGTGTLSRHPELKWRLSVEEIERLAAQGFEMLTGLAECLAPEGLLAVITCSIEREENEEVVARLLEERSELKPLDLATLLPESFAQHLDRGGVWRALPNPTRDGFTVQVLQRTAH